MAKFEFCRICLVDNVRMFKVDDSHLQEVYKKLTDIPFVTEDTRPKLACYLCYARLKQCCRFMMKCLDAEERLTQMLDKNNKKISIAVQNNKFISDFIRTPIENYDFHNFELELVSANKYIDSHETDHVNIKKENVSDDEFINREQHDSDANMTNKINEIDINIKEEEHVLDYADVEEESTGAPAAKKPKIEIQIENIEVAISTKMKINGLRNTKVRCKSRSRASKCVSKIIEPIPRNSIRESKMNKSIINQENRDAENVSTNSNISNDVYKNIVVNNDDIECYNLSHSDVNFEKSHKCNVCQRSFKLKSNLKKHIRIHTGEKPYQCDVCESSFSEKRSLRNHILIHTGEKPYNCDVCQSGFTNKSSLKIHARIHTGEKPYKCEVCRSGFTNKNSLKIHIRTHTGEKPYKCDLCQRSFSVKNNLKKHKYIHTGEKPYKCDVCESSFNQKSSLRNHIRVHTGEKPHKCDVCQRSFHFKSHLQAHSRIHTGEKPYKCDVCHSSFNERGTLKSHVRRHTGNKP